MARSSVHVALLAGVVALFANPSSAQNPFDQMQKALKGMQSSGQQKSAEQASKSAGRETTNRERVEVGKPHEIALPLPGDPNSVSCGVKVDWGDGSSDRYRAGKDLQLKPPFNIQHSYTKPGIYNLAIEGETSVRGLNTVGACDIKLRRTIEAYDPVEEARKLAQEKEQREAQEKEAEARKVAQEKASAEQREREAQEAEARRVAQAKVQAEEEEKKRLADKSKPAAKAEAKTSATPDGTKGRTSKASEELLNFYTMYIFIQRCYDSRKQYTKQYITKAEYERARTQIKRDEADTIKSDPTLVKQKDKIWDEAQAKVASAGYSNIFDMAGERWIPDLASLCLVMKNTYLSGVESSRTKKDF
jgi:hypothetical protein